MNRVLIAISVVFLAVSIQSCKLDSCINKSYFVSTYDNFIKDLSENSSKYSEADWLSKEQKMREFVNDCYANHSASMEVDEKISFWTKYVQFMITRNKGQALSAIEKEDKASPVEIYDEIANSIDNADLEQLFKDIYGDELEEVLDDVLKEANKLVDQLKDWLDKK